MPRSLILALLSSYRASEEQDARAALLAIEFIKKNPRCFERSLSDGHITGSAWLLHPDGASVLLTHHAKLGRWMQLGGHADGETDILKVALKEAIEESGIEEIHPVTEEIFDVDVHEIPARGSEGAHLHFDVRFLLRAENSSFKVSAESKELAWVAMEKVPEYSDEESLLRMTRKWESFVKNHPSLVLRPKANTSVPGLTSTRASSSKPVRR